MTLEIIFFYFALQKLDVLSESSPLPQSESTLNDTMASSLTDSLDRTTNIKIRSSKLTEEHSTVIGSVTNTMQVIQFNISLFL